MPRQMIKVILFATVTIAGSLILKLWHRLRHRSLSKQHGCKRPSRRQVGDPIFGLKGLLQDFQAIARGRIFQSLSVLHSKYGSTYTEETLCRGTTIWTIDPRNIQTIWSLKHDDWLVEPMRMSAMYPLMGRGILTSDGVGWDHARALLRPAFHQSNISDMCIVEKAACQLISQIPGDGTTVDIKPLLLQMFTDVSLDFLLGTRNNECEKDGEIAPLDLEAFGVALQQSLQLCALRLILGRFRALLTTPLTTGCLKRVHSYVDRHISKFLADDQKSNDKHQSVLQIVSQRIRDPVQLRNQILQGTAAAQDTTSALVTNTIFLLSRQPDVWQRVRAEALATTKDQLCVEDTKKLKMIRNVLRETLRFCPVFPMVGRTSRMASMLPAGGGEDGQSAIYVPAGTDVNVCFHALYRDKVIFGEDADEFDPDRWDRISPGQWSYLVFGGGPRTCLGQVKAMAEACCTIVRLAQKFERLESRDHRDWTMAPGFVGHNANGCHVAFFAAQEISN